MTRSMTGVMGISNFFLCDYCRNNMMDVWLETCLCRAKNMEHVPKKVMHDGTKKPTDVCEHYVARRGDACTVRV